jgi:methanethiol S-methyltransferase
LEKLITGDPIGPVAMMQSSIVDITAYGLFWLLFGLLHSFMASDTFKEPWLRILGPLAPLERLFFNGISTVAILAVFSFGHHNLSKAVFFGPEGAVKWLLLIIQGAGFIIVLWSFFSYDIWRFMGLKQLVVGLKKERIGPEPLVVTSLHRFVRHPMYSGLLLILWFQPMDEMTFISHFFATLYLLLGLRWEEGRLSALYEGEYDRYKQVVPPLIPHPKRRWQPKPESRSQ